MAGAWEIVHVYTSPGINANPVNITYEGVHYTYVKGPVGTNAGGWYDYANSIRREAECRIYPAEGGVDCGEGTLDYTDYISFKSNCNALPIGGTVKIVAYDKTSSYFSQHLCEDEQYD